MSGRKMEQNKKPCQQKCQKYNIYMQKEKKQSQLLATLSQILKLYHKYLLYSLRSDIINQRRSGMLENIRERVRSIVEKEIIQNTNFQSENSNSKPQQTDGVENKPKYENRLASRFLGRLSEKIKGYMEQFPTNQIPNFLVDSGKIIEKMSSNLQLTELLKNLFALGNQSSRPVKKQSRKNSSTQGLLNQPQKKKPTPNSDISTSDKVEKKTCFMSAFNKKSNDIQEIIELIAILELDEKDIRRKYFSILQNSSQFIQQPQLRQSSKIQSTVQQTPIIHTTNIVATNSEISLQSKDNKISLIVSNTTYSSFGTSNQLYIDMLQRNKTISQMIKKYETFYDKYRKREQVKQQRERQKEKSRHKQAVNFSHVPHVPHVHSLDLMQMEKTSYHCYNDQIQNDYAQNEKMVDKIEFQAKEKKLQREIHNIGVFKNDLDNIGCQKKIDSQFSLSAKEIESKFSSQKQLIMESHRNKQQIIDNYQHMKEANGAIEKLHRSTSQQNSSLPQLKTMKCEYKVEASPYNPQIKAKLRRAQKLLRITKPSIKLGIIPQTPNIKANQKSKQKSLSTIALLQQNNIANTSQSTSNIINNHIIDLNSYTQEQFKIKQRQGEEYSDVTISASTYNNLNNIVKPKQLLNKFLNKVNSSASASVSGTGDNQNTVLNLSKIQFISANSSLADINMENQNQKKTKKTSLHKNQLQERRAKVQALYMKQRPTQLGFLRVNHISYNYNLPKIQDIEAPSFLMACRSYQKAVQFNNTSSVKISNEHMSQGGK